MAETTTTPRPKVGAGESTGPQTGGNRIGSVAGVPLAVLDPRTPGFHGRRSNSAAADSETPGIPPAPEGSYETYREILRDDTVALGRAVVWGPILASEWSYVKAADDVPDEWRDFIEEQFNPLADFIKAQSLRYIDFGNRSFEQTYQVVTFNGSSRIGFDKIKPLRPDITEVLIDASTGQFAGLRNDRTTLQPNEVIHLPYDMEDDDYYGRSRLENVREGSWWPYKFFEQQAAKLGRKVSNIVPVVKGPLASTETDADGNELSGLDAGLLVLNALVRGDGVLVENLAAAIDDLRGDPELAKTSKWVIDSYDVGSSATAVAPLESILRYYDAKKMRGMLRPERTATEGQHGTKNEVAEQADVGLAEGEQIARQIAGLWNKFSVNRLLVWNFGEQARDKVRIEPAALIDEKRAVFRWIWTALLANPAVLDLIATRLDLDAMADQLGIPRLASVDFSEDDLTPPVPDPFGGGGGGPGAPPPGPLNTATSDVPVAASRGRRGRSAAVRRFLLARYGDGLPVRRKGRRR